ncbi:MAG: hypothetical protein IKR25_11555 [Muribaculaceae bacterium]|nr:hypothetical protein [Muribaculaceae bacterium]
MERQKVLMADMVLLDIVFSVAKVEHYLESAKKNAHIERKKQLSAVTIKRQLHP